MLIICPGCERETRRDVGLRSGKQRVICSDCADDGLTPEDFNGESDE